MQQPRNTTKLYRLPPNVIYFLFYCKSNLFFIFLNKNKHKMIYKNIISLKSSSVARLHASAAHDFSIIARASK